MNSILSIVLGLFNLGGGEVFLILFIVLLLFGAKKIPELARGLGKGMREFKDAAKGVEKEISEAQKQIEEKK